MINYCKTNMLLGRRTTGKSIIMFAATLFIVLPSAAQMIQDPDLFAYPPYPWMDRCDEEIGATVPAFSCTDDSIGMIAPKLMHGDTCEKPEDLNARCVHMSRIGRLNSGNPDVDIVFSCRKDPDKNLHKGDKGVNFWDIAVIQYNKKNGKTCFYQYLNFDTNKDAKPGAPKSNSPDGKDFWNLRVDFCTGCHTNGPFVRSPHYYKEIENKGVKYIPEKQVYSDPVPYKVIHDHFPVYNVDIEGNDCTTCHNIGAFFALGEFHIGQVNKLAAGTIKSLVHNDTPSPTTGSYNGYNHFMTNEAKALSSDAGTDVSWEDAKKAIKELEACLVGQTRATIDKAKLPKGCELTPISTYDFPLPCLTRECEEIQR